MKKGIYLFSWIFSLMMFMPGVQAQFRLVSTSLEDVAEATASLSQSHDLPDMAYHEVVAQGREEFVVKIYNDNYVILHLNAKGNVTEYFLLQHVPSTINFGKVSSATYRQSSDIIIATADGKFYQFYINDSNLQPGSNYNKLSVAGIANFKILSDDGYPFDKLAGHFSNEMGATGGSEIAGCDSKCLSGGCGSKSCDRSIDTNIVSLSCSVDCNTGYFACCGDVALYGCKCIKDSCCPK
jgi:hypothetical protein